VDAQTQMCVWVEGWWAELPISLRVSSTENARSTMQQKSSASVCEMETAEWDQDKSEPVA
jgi:hypothetical protein